MTFLFTDIEGSTRLWESSAEAMTGHPMYIATTAVVAASIYISTRCPHDFAACVAVFEQVSGLTMSDVDASITMWVEGHLGAALAGLHDPAAVAHLARAFRLGEQGGAPHVQDWTLRLLAVAAADMGRMVDAETLVGYTEAKLRPHRILSSSHQWIDSVLEEMLPITSDRIMREQAGASATRREIIALVDGLEHAATC